MKIPCIRCSKKLNKPDARNADYIIAPDTIVREPVDVIIALKHNQATLAKLAKMKEADAEGKLLYPDLVILESDYTAVEVPSIKAAEQSFGEDLVKVVPAVKVKDVQKTGIICPNCHKDTDTVIWGVHKVKAIK